MEHDVSLCPKTDEIDSKRFKKNFDAFLINGLCDVKFKLPTLYTGTCHCFKQYKI